MLSNVTPRFSGFDVAHCGPGNAKTSGDERLGHTRIEKATDFVNCFQRQFGNAIQTMNGSLSHIRGFCPPFKIGQVIVFLVVVEMAALHSMRASATECFQDQKMQRTQPLFAITAQSDHDVSVVASRLFENLGAVRNDNPGMVDSPPVGGYLPVIGNLITQEAGDVTPCCFLCHVRILQQQKAGSLTRYKEKR